MTSNTVFLITGANRGIGLGLTEALLKRSNTTVIASVRSSSTDTAALNALPIAAKSQLIITILPGTDDDAANSTTTQLSNQGITHIDTTIANAGSGDTFRSSITTSLDELRSNFEVNTLGPIRLFQDIFPLLQKSPNAKFIFISSSLGSIGAMEGKLPSLAYGVSKAAANYFVRKVHFEHDITAVAIHPGWVKTRNGQAFADTLGIAEPPMTLEESVKGVLEQIDGASKTSTSGSFVSYDGTIIPW